MFTEQEIWRLLAKSIFNECNAAEEEVLQQLLQSRPELQQQYDLLLHTLKNHHTAKDENNDVKARQIIAKANSLSKQRQTSVIVKMKRSKAFWTAAAVLLIFCSVWLYETYNHPAKKIEKMALATKNGTRNHMVLPDGSTVWLNAGSKLYYVNNFRTGTREVRLEGEGYFDIMKDTAKPFIVHANNINIKVLGTAFNVRAYTEDKSVVTTLYRGLVNITKSDDNSFQPIMLYPNQKIILPKENILASDETVKTTTPVNALKKSIIIKQIDSAKIETKRIETAWMFNRLEFRGDDFTMLASKLEHWYDVKIIFEDENVKALSFNGSFEKETIQQAMHALQIANSFTYKIKNNEVFISSSR